MMPTIRREIAAVDPTVPLSEDYPLAARVTFEFRHIRMTMTMLVSFAVLSIVLAATGLYGVVAFAMSLRTREIAIRLALGASPDQMRLLIVRHGLKVAAVGAGIGLAAAVAGARVLSRMLYGVRPDDAGTFVAVAAMLIALTLVASGIPARRAMRVDPALTLRQE
jgi:ABC-type lipoprotein release transport system permease subunit